MGSRLIEYILIALLLSLVIKLLFLSDLNKRAYNHTPGGCRLVSSISNGSAGMEYVKEADGAFITSGYIKNYGFDNLTGDIYYYDFKNKNQNYEVKKLKISMFDKSQFIPYGISSFVSRGRVILYVTNNYGRNSTVEVFQYEHRTLTLKHRKTIRSPLFNNLMDIVTVGADRFIATNFVYSKYSYLQLAELILQTPLGSVVYYDGKTANYVEKYLPTPSGIATDKNKEYLYIASSLQKVIRVYRLKKDMLAVKKFEINLLTSPLNLFVDYDSGDIWVAAQPVVYKTIQHLWYPSSVEYRSPSQVLRIRIQKDRRSWVITEPYANDGATLWGSSSVLFTQDQILIGSFFGRLLHCSIEYPQLV